MTEGEDKEEGKGREEVVELFIASGRSLLNVLLHCTVAAFGFISMLI